MSCSAPATLFPPEASKLHVRGCGCDECLPASPAPALVVPSWCHDCQLFLKRSLRGNPRRERWICEGCTKVTIIFRGLVP